MSGRLPLIFFVSGAAALIFETLWFSQAGLAFGNSVYSAAITLSSFMAGLAIGNAAAARYGPRVERPIRAYAWLELAIAGFGISIVFVLPGMGRVLVPLFRAVTDAPWALSTVRFGSAFAVMVIPAAAMGATLPLLVRALLREDPSFGGALGRLYGWNTLGAVAGALAAEVVLVEAIGVSRTAAVAVGLNMVAALLALRLSAATEASNKSSDSPEAPPPVTATAGGRLLLAAGLAGALALALEVVWFRFMMLSQAGTSLVFVVMLCVVLAGIGGGGLAAARVAQRDPEAHRHLRPLVLAAGALVVVGYRAFHPAFVALGGETEHGLWRAVGYGAVLMLPVSAISGAVFTLLGVAARARYTDATKTVGLLTLANTAGAAIGSAIGGFVLLPAMGMERSFFVAAVGYGVIAALIPSPHGASRPSRSMLAVAAVWVVSLVAFPFGHMQRDYFDRVADRYGAHLVEVREGLNQTAFYLRSDRFGMPSFYRLATDRYSMSATEPAALRYMKLFVWLPVALHPEPRDALLISYGVGSTARALVDEPAFEHIDVVDVSRDIVELSRIIYPQDHPLDDPRVTLHIEDGRFFLQTTDRQYDLITGEPPPPKNAGIVNLYSQEYFELIRTRLRPGGMCSYWLPVHTLTEDDTLAIVGGFCGAFDDCTLWAGAGLDWILLGTNDAQGPVTAETFRRQWDNPQVAAQLEGRAVERPEQLGATFMAGTDDLLALSGDHRPLTDDFPRRVSARQMWTLEHSPLYAGLMHEPAAAQRFAQSAFVQRMWPAQIRDATMPYFRHQRAIKTALLPIYRTPGDYPWEELRAVLRDTELRTVPLWLMGSSRREQDIVAALGPDHEHGPQVDGRRAIGLLADHRYREAAVAFRWYIEAAEPDDQARAYPLLVFAHALGGDAEGANRAAAEFSAHPAARDPRFWQWAQATLGVSPGP